MSNNAADLVGGFDLTLSSKWRRRVEALARYGFRCRSERVTGGGATCLLTSHVYAYQRLGLLDNFARFGCKRYRCSQDEELCAATNPARVH